MTFNQVLDWIKANLVIVIFVVVMIAAPIAMFFVAGGMNKAVKAEVTKRAGSVSQLTGLTVDLNGQQVTPTEALLRQYGDATKSLAEDAAAVQKQALEFNRKGRGVLMQDVFPEPPFELREIIPERFHKALMAAYAQLLTDIRAGSPPSLESLRTELLSMRGRFISQDLKKDPSATLEPEEAQRLREMLSQARLGMYKQSAASIGMYADMSVLFVPPWNASRLPSTAEMFNWQWQYWAVDDFLKALASVNASASSVADAPVKRLLGVVVVGFPKAEGGSDASAAAGASAPRLSGGFGEGEGAAPAEEGADEAAGGARAGIANPKAPVQRDFGGSLAGLVSNPLYDVLTVDFAIVVETARLPEVLDAVSRYNFNTIVNLRVENADSFAATEQGFFYGSEPVCTATIRMQTVWLREWTKQFMPPATRETLGIAPDATAAAAAQE